MTDMERADVVNVADCSPQWRLLNRGYPNGRPLWSRWHPCFSTYRKNAEYAFSHWRNDCANGTADTLVSHSSAFSVFVLLNLALSSA